MFDVFISHSSIDKTNFVEPLVKELEKLGLLIWYDKNDISKGDEIKDSIIQGIKDSVIFIAILSENYLNSCWANLELGMLEMNFPDNCLPIVFTDTKTIIANQYPFILDHNYIENNKTISDISRELYNVVTKKKQDRGLWHTEKTNLKSLIRELHSYNNFKLEQVAIYLNKIVKNLNQNVLLSLNDIILILELILNDVANTENIFLPENACAPNRLLDMDFLNENLKEHVKYLLKIRKKYIQNFSRSISIDQEECYLIQFSVYSLIEWYAITYFKKPIIRPANIIAVSPEEFTKEDIVESFNIEKLVLPPNLIASVTTDLKWYKHNPLTIIGARDKTTGKLIGFFNTIPIKDSLYEQIKSGTFDDTELSIDDIRQYDIPGFYKLYLCSFCIHPAYNATTAFKIIYTSFIDFLLNLATEREIFISDIIADGVTSKGQSLCESIGMTKITQSCHSSTIYEASLIPPTYTTLKLNNIIGKRLISYYNMKYNEYKEIF